MTRYSVTDDRAITHQLNHPKEIILFNSLHSVKCFKFSIMANFKDKSPVLLLATIKLKIRHLNQIFTWATSNETYCTWNIVTFCLYNTPVYRCVNHTHRRNKLCCQQHLFIVYPTSILYNCLSTCLYAKTSLHSIWTIYWCCL